MITATPDVIRDTIASIDKVLRGIVSDKPVQTFISHVGSSYTHGAGEDIDFMVFVGGDREEAKRVLDEADYKYTGVDCSGSEDEFDTFRNGVVNVILTDDMQFFSDMCACSEIVKYLVSSGHVIDKPARIKIHRILMNGESA